MIDLMIVWRAFYDNGKQEKVFLEAVNKSKVATINLLTASRASLPKERVCFIDCRNFRFFDSLESVFTS